MSNRKRKAETVERSSADMAADSIERANDRACHDCQLRELDFVRRGLQRRAAGERWPPGYEPAAGFCRKPLNHGGLRV